MTLELCCECGEPTGRAGKGDDSLYIMAQGPYCEACYGDRKCVSCDGLGEIPLLVNRRGQVDYLDGSPSGEYVMCDHCHGEGYRT